MKILVTAASGHLGHLVVESLLERGVSPADLFATSRDTTRLGDLSSLGVEVRHADYDDPDTLDSALAGVDRVVFISASEVGSRRSQHRNMVEAATRSGTQLIAYTSILRADTSDLVLANEHRETERLFAESGVPTVLLRNGWYLENYTAQAASALEHGVVLGAAGDGHVSAATRADYAAAAAAVIVADDQAGQVYELGGDGGFTLAEYAATLAEASGHDVSYRDLTEPEYRSALVEAGVPEALAAMVADGDRGIRDGALFTDSGDLSRLIGHPTTSLEDAVRAALATGP